MRRERVLQDETGHAVRRRGFQVIGERGVGCRPVEVVRVDDRERRPHGLLAAEDGVSGAPRFFPPGGDAEAGRQAVEFLEHVRGVGGFLDGLADALAEGRFHRLADHEDDAAEARLQGVMDGIGDGGFSVRADRRQRLEPAIARAQSGGHDDECRVRHFPLRPRTRRPRPRPRTAVSYSRERGRLRGRLRLLRGARRSAPGQI